MACRQDCTQAETDEIAKGRQGPASHRSRRHAVSEDCPDGLRALIRIEETDPKTGETVFTPH